MRCSVMFFRWFRRNERGSVMVIVALALTVLLGCTGLAVDYGSMALTRQELQNAADAAALAAGQDMLNGLGLSSQTSTANHYITVNGFTPGDGVTTSEVTNSGSTVRVTITTKKKVGFSAVLTGRNVEEVSATAVAEVMNPFENFPYAMFAGDTIDEGGSGIDANANKTVITGNIHSNSDIMLHNKTEVNGVATAVGKIGGTEDGSPFIPMPSIDNIVNHVLSSKHAYFDDDVKIKSNEGGFAGFISQALEKCGGSPSADGLNIYVDGNLEIQGDAFYNNQYPINLIVAGDITLGGTPLTSTEATPVILISLEGDMTVNGQGSGSEAFCGIIFCAKGDVTLHGGNQSNYVGSIYAMNIRKTGAPLKVGYSNKVDDHLAEDKVRLIE